MVLKENMKLGGGMMRKTWERCKSFSHSQQTTSKKVGLLSTSNTNTSSICSSQHVMVKSKSWSSLLLPSTPRRSSKLVSSGRMKTPKGCLSVYVGAEKQRFVIKIECTNHPLFRELLEQTEMEYGFSSDGPIFLPCDVDVFINLIYDMADHMISPNSHSHSARSRTSYHMLRPSSARFVPH